MGRVGMVCLLLAVGGCDPTLGVGPEPPPIGGGASPVFDAGFFAPDGGPDGATPCMPDMFEPNNSFANGQVATLPGLMPNQTVTFDLDIDAPDDVDWFYVPMAANRSTPTETPPPTASFYVDLSGIADGDDDDVSLWEGCTDYDAVTASSCIDGNAEVPLPMRVDGGVVAGPPGCVSAHPGNADEHVAEIATCVSPSPRPPPAGSASPNVAWVRVQPKRWSGMCGTYRLSIAACEAGPEGTADTPGNAYDLTPFTEGERRPVSLGFAFEAPGDADWLVLDDPDPAPASAPTFTDVQMTVTSHVTELTVELFFACEDGTGEIACTGTSTAPTADLGDGSGPRTGCGVTSPAGTATIMGSVSCGGGPIAGHLYAYVTSDLAHACVPYTVTVSTSGTSPAGDAGTPVGDGGSIGDGGAITDASGTDGGAITDGGIRDGG